MLKEFDLVHSLLAMVKLKWRPVQFSREGGRPTASKGSGKNSLSGLEYSIKLILITLVDDFWNLSWPFLISQWLSGWAGSGLGNGRHFCSEVLLIPLKLVPISVGR